MTKSHQFTGSVPTLAVQCNKPSWDSSNSTTSPPQIESLTKEQLLAKIASLEYENKKIKQDNEKLRGERYQAELKYKMQAAKCAKLKAAAAKDKLNIRVIKKKKVTRVQIKEIVHDALKDYFSKTQIDWFLNKNQRNKKAKAWSQSDLTIALTLKTLSKAAYNFIRRKKLIPLPGLETLRRHFKGFVVDEGHLDHVYQLLTLMALNMSAVERIVVLSFDEVSVKADLSYDATQDRILGPKSQANVIMARGLYSKFKIPIFFQFDQPLEEKDLLFAIQNLSKAGYHVAAVCCDMGTKNNSVQKKLGVTIENPWFEHPDRPNSRVYWFHDIPHLIKLLRNHLLSQGFVLANGTSFGKQELEKMYNKLLKSDLNPAKKLSHAHINVSGQDKQKVFLATQLLSQTTANCLIQCDPEDETMQQMSQFFSDINSLFDIFNSRTKLHKSNEVGNAYGLNLDAQNKVLERCYETISSLRAVWDNKDGCKNALQEWQKGFLKCINALKPMLIELKQEYKEIDSICTYFLNQDCLETCFSVLRGMGHFYREFGALEFIRRLRNYCLGAGGDVTIKAANVEPTEENEFKIESFIDKDLEVEVSVEKPIELNAAAIDTPENILDECDIQLFDDCLDGFQGINKAQLNQGQQSGLDNFANELDMFERQVWVDKNRSELQGIAEETLMADLQEMEKHFQNFHANSSDGLLRTKNVTKDLVSNLKLLFPNYRDIVLKKFVLSRTMARMKHIYRTTIKHSVTSRAQKKVIELVQTKPACQLKEEKTEEKVAEKKPAKKPVKKPAKKAAKKPAKKPAEKPAKKKVVVVKVA